MLHFNLQRSVEKSHMSESQSVSAEPQLDWFWTFFPFFFVSFLQGTSKKIMTTGKIILTPTKKEQKNGHNFCVQSQTVSYVFSKHRPSGPMLSKSGNVHLSVRLSVCSLLRYRLNVFLPPLPEVGCQIFLEIRNPWGKVMESSGLTFEHFCLEVV